MRIQNIEQIKAFLYRAILCEKPILFLIANMECLDFSLTHDLIKTLRALYKYKNKEINSYLLWNILNNNVLQKPEKIKETFDKIELYTSKFSGYGKTTEIIYKVKEKGRYYYLPIGGSFTRNFVINNLKNLKLDTNIGNIQYLHLDLSESDNDDLIQEVLFKLIILKFLNSEENIFYLGYDIHLIIEIPKGFIDFE